MTACGERERERGRGREGGRKRERERERKRMCVNESQCSKLTQLPDD